MSKKKMINSPITKTVGGVKVPTRSEGPNRMHKNTLKMPTGGGKKTTMRG